MIQIDIYNNMNVKVTTNEEDFAGFLDNKGNVKTKFFTEDGILLLGKKEVIKDINDFFNQ